MTVQTQEPLQLNKAAPGKSWFRAAMLADDHVVEIRGVIGDYEVDPVLLIARLNAADQDVTIARHVLRVDSHGGIVEAGVSLMTAISQLDKPVVVEIWGSCYSMATLLAMAADQVLIAKDGSFMIHNPRTVVWGTANDLRTSLQYLDGVRVQAVDRYTAKVEPKGRTRDEVEAAMTDAGTVYTAAEAVEFGYADGFLEDKREPLPAEEPAAAPEAAATEAEAQAEPATEAKADETPAAEAKADATDASDLSAEMVVDAAAKAKMQADASPVVAAMKSAGEQPAVSTARTVDATQDKPAAKEPAPWQARVAEMNRNFGRF